MITTINPSDVKSDMLTTESKVQDILRALYFYGADYIAAVLGRKERLIHKEQLVALLEQGREMATIEDIMSVVLNEPLSARMQMENIPPYTLLLVFLQTGSGPNGELSRMTFEEYREMKIRELEVILPEWWGIPLPLVCIKEDKVFMNDHATSTVPCDVKTLARQIDRMVADRIVTVKEKKRERTFSLLPLAENTFLIEDISGDFEMAEELVWWAAVGRAFFHRLEENGAVIRRLSPLEEPPNAAAEIIPCSWEGELVGSLAIGLPADMARETLEPEPEPAPEPIDVEKTAQEIKNEQDLWPKGQAPEKETFRAAHGPRKNNSAKEAKKIPKRNIPASPVIVEDIKNDEELGTQDLEDSSENSGNLARINKNAARKAYGGGISAKKPAPRDGKKD